MKVLDGFQLAYKVTASGFMVKWVLKLNSVTKDAACTTAIGRKEYMMLKKVLREWAESENYNLQNYLWRYRFKLFVKFLNTADK